MAETDDTGFSRRTFLTLAGAAAAFAAAAVALLRPVWGEGRGGKGADARPNSVGAGAVKKVPPVRWQKFTEEAMRVVFFAQEEAARQGENEVGTEHLLLGLLRERDSGGVRTLSRMGVSVERARNEVIRQVKRGPGNKGEDIMLTPDAKRVIELANEEAFGLASDTLGSEHLLLGLIREEKGLGGKVLRMLGATLKPARAAVARLSSGR